MILMCRHDPTTERALSATRKAEAAWEVVLDSYQLDKDERSEKQQQAFTAAKERTQLEISAAVATGATGDSSGAAPSGLGVGHEDAPPSFLLSHARLRPAVAIGSGSCASPPSPPPGQVPGGRTAYGTTRLGDPEQCPVSGCTTRLRTKQKCKVCPYHCTTEGCSSHNADKAGAACARVKWDPPPFGSLLPPHPSSLAKQQYWAACMHLNSRYRYMSGHG